MVSKLSVLSSMVAVVAMLGSTANADIYTSRYRHLDDLAFSAFVDARDLRWVIHDNFIDSRDYQHLMNDADDIVAALQDVQVAIYRERPDAVILREICQAQKQVANLSSHLNGCDFARSSQSRFRPAYQGRGYSFIPETRHAGRIHVHTALKMIARIESALAALEREVCPNHGRQSHVPIQPPIIEEPPIPVPALPPQETRNRSQRYFEIPVGNSGSGGFVFRIGY